MVVIITIPKSSKTLLRGAALAFSDVEVELIAVHLYPDLLKKLYANELPAIIQKNALNPKTTKIADGSTITRFIESLDFYFENPSLANDDLLELKIRELMLLLVQTNNSSSILELIQDLYSNRNTDLKSVVQLHQYNNLSIEEAFSVQKHKQAIID